MAFISATRLRVKSIWHLPAFFGANEASAKQLQKTPGFLAGKELIDKNFTFWTLTCWNHPADMKVFRNAEAHRKAMQKLPVWCDEATYVHWHQEDTTLPGWDIVHQKMITEGKVTKVRNPSPNHNAKNFPPVKWKRIERIFR